MNPPVAHVLEDIDKVHGYVDAILNAQKQNGRASQFRNAGVALMPIDPDGAALQAARNFVAGGMRSVFLQDGNSLIIEPSGGFNPEEFV